MSILLSTRAYREVVHANTFDNCSYKQLNKVDRTLAVETFKKNKDFYHPICRSLVEKDLFGDSKRA